MSSLKHIYTGDVTGAGVYEPYSEDRVEPIVDQFFDIYDDGKASVSSIFQYNNMNKEDSDIFLSAPEKDSLSEDDFFQAPPTPTQEPEEQFSFDSTESFEDIESDLEFEDIESTEDFDDFEDSNFEDIFEE